MPRKKPKKEEQPVDGAPVIPISTPTKRRSRKKAAPQPPVTEALLKMTDMETLRLGKLDAEVRQMQQAVQTLDQAVLISEMKVKEQVRDMESQLTAYKAQKTDERQGLVALLHKKAEEYKAEVASIVEKYGLDPTKFSYDTDTGTLRDLRVPPTEGQPPPE